MNAGIVTQKVETEDVLSVIPLHNTTILSCDNCNDTDLDI